MIQADAPGPSQNKRVVHTFDFDERKEGNLESIPKFWIPFGGPTFQRFASGTFDDAVGHDAPPSFRLESQGRNVAYRYVGSATRVRPRSDHLIVGWVRGGNLQNARAALSAYYLDQDHLPIASTQRFSALIGGGDEETWHRLEVYLPVGPPQSKTIGLTAWLVQEEVWRTGPKPKRHIVQYDVGGRAWFDDIMIYRRPRVTLETQVPGNVFHSGSDQTLRVLVTDAQSTELKATLDIFDIEGRTIYSVDVPVHGDEHAPPTAIDLGRIDNGLYRASLRIHAGKEVLAKRVLVFAKAGATARDASSVSRSFGVVLDAQDRADPAIELAMLRTLNVGAVKIPVWSGSAIVPDLADTAERMDVLLYELLKARVAITGVFAGPPAELVRAAGAYSRSLLAILNDDVTAWREHLVHVVARYSSVFRSWQVGTDDDESLVSDLRLDRAIDRVRVEMETLTTAPRLTSPGSLSWEPSSGHRSADDLCLTLANTILPPFIQSHIDEYRANDQPISSIYIQPPPPDDVDPSGQWRDWCKRLLQTRHAGVRTVFVPQPWHTRETVDGPVTEPTPQFILLDTIVNLIGEALPGERVRVAPGVTALAFHKNEKTLLALWDDQADPAGRTHLIQLGSATRRVDMWGRPTPLERSQDGRHRITLTAQPTFIDGVDRWLLMFRTLLVLTPDLVEFSMDRHRIALTIVNPHTQPIEGQVRIVPPRGWDIKPRRFHFILGPGERTVEPLEIQFDRNATAGKKTIDIHVDLRAHETYKLVVPLAFEIGIKDLDVWGLAFAAGKRVIVRHGVTNGSSRTLNLRSYAIAPGRLRQYRILNAFQPGQTTTLEYSFRNPESLRGRTLRLHLRELNGPRMHNIEVTVE